MIEMQVTGDRELMSKLNGMPNKIRMALVRKITALSIQLEAHIKRDKLDGQVLHVRSGHLSQSIFHEVEDTGNAVIATVASGGNIPYAAIHEYGGRTAAHEIFPTKGQALAFIWGGKQVFFKSVHHPGSVMPERSYMRSSLADMAQQIIDGMNQAVGEGVA